MDDANTFGLKLALAQGRRLHTALVTTKEEDSARGTTEPENFFASMSKKMTIMLFFKRSITTPQHNLYTLQYIETQQTFSQVVHTLA